MLYNTFKHYIEYRIVEDKLNAVRDDNARAEPISRLWLYDNFGKGGI